MGRLAALRFGRAGAKVVVAARNGAALDSLVSEIEESGGEAVAFTADVADFDQVKAVANGAVGRFGRIDTWVNFAATAVYAEAKDTTPEEFHRVVQVNLFGQMHGAMAALPYLRRAQSGALIFISSVEGEVSMPYHSAYAASKHGLNGYIDALRLELAHEKSSVRLSTIMPTGVNTPFFNNARTKLGVKPKPPQPIYRPEHVADVVLYAAENHGRDFFVGGAAKMFVIGNRWMPRVVEAYLLGSMFRAQRTNVPKSAEDPSALFASETGDSRVQGDYTPIARRHSLYVWLQTHPLACGVIKGLALLVGAAAVERYCARNCRSSMTERAARRISKLF
jgi:NAD(P)-dependent dehydrogenase (short-subunit alcohol dehydrogenase family)